ncbi:hypothetical protein DE146DRAFT_347898 [Phaeosphaeria sp. MPI-PUGE-AT-0046c]|nr:hypothetical protein DE146DRAFT_347898 [Phaeosphaeria sp. MPI-PUGE-AT-0046c]
MLNSVSIGFNGCIKQSCHFLTIPFHEFGNQHTVHNTFKMQRQVELQRTWPIQHRHCHDSVISCSSLCSYKAAAISPNQYAAQPQMLVALTPSPGTLLQSKDMERKDSEISRSSNQRCFCGPQHASIGHGSAIGEFNMSRTSTQHSPISASEYPLSSLAQLQTTPYQFDFNSHGTPSKEPMLTASSGVDAQYSNLQLSDRTDSLFTSSLGDIRPAGMNGIRCSGLAQTASNKDRSFEQCLNLNESVEIKPTMTRLEVE